MLRRCGPALQRSQASRCRCNQASPGRCNATPASVRGRFAASARRFAATGCPDEFQARADEQEGSTRQNQAGMPRTGRSRPPACAGAPRGPRAPSAAATAAGRRHHSAVRWRAHWSRSTSSVASALTSSSVKRKRALASRQSSRAANEARGRNGPRGATGARGARGEPTFWIGMYSDRWLASDRKNLHDRAGSGPPRCQVLSQRCRSFLEDAGGEGR